MIHRVGDWTFRLEPDGSVAHVAYRDEEILRGVRYVVRAAHTWDTIEASIQVSATTSPERVEVVISARHDIGKAYFHREARIDVTADRISFVSAGSANEGFEVNRNGWVLLHPLSLAGRAVDIRHPDGSSERGIFPIAVAPHQPFVDVAEYAYRTSRNTPVRIMLDGDVFEMEDQRNWSDASYKTYSRPLAEPFPYRIEAREMVHQAIDVVVDHAVAGDLALPVAAPDAFTPLPTRPSLGVALGPDDDPVDAADLCRRLGLDHVRVDVVLDATGARGLERAAILMREQIPLELVVHVGSAPAAVLADVADAVQGAALSALVVLDDDAPATTARAWNATAALRSAVGDVPVFVGADDNLAELNRNRPDAAWGADGVTFGLTPQLHDQREEAVIETIEALPAMIATALAFGKQVAVGSLTMRPRRNIYTGTHVDRLGREDSGIDPRQARPWAAQWLRGTLVTLAAVGTTRITALEFTGPRGIVGTQGDLLPVGEVLAELASLDDWVKS